jgi:hypothetical protein
MKLLVRLIVQKAWSCLFNWYYRQHEAACSADSTDSMDLLVRLILQTVWTFLFDWYYRQHEAACSVDTTDNEAACSVDTTDSIYRLETTDNIHAECHSDSLPVYVTSGGRHHHDASGYPAGPPVTLRCWGRTTDRSPPDCTQHKYSSPNINSSADCISGDSHPLMSRPQCTPFQNLKTQNVKFLRLISSL